MLSEPVEVTLQVADVLESLGITYAIGGSMASTAYGRVRTTMDVDLVADLWPEHVEPIVDALSGTFYVDAAAMHAAVERRTNFNLIHLETMFKVDIFVAKERPFDRQQLARRVRRVIASDPERKAYFTSAEDTILARYR